MPRIDSIIAVAGWEGRFVVGVEKDVETYAPSELVVIVFQEYVGDTHSNRLQIEQLAARKGIHYAELRVQRKFPAKVWQQLQERFSTPDWASKRVLVDITTMPREVIWWSFRTLQAAGSTVSYIYYRPGRYASEWVTRDTERPRLVYQSSGVSEFGRDTCLLIVSGFDIDRAAQMIQLFEPASVLIGLQAGTQFDNQTKNIERHRAALARSPYITYFDIDAYSPDHGLASMEAATAAPRKQYNMVAASLGPKLSAVALYHLHCKDTNLALAYAPSRQFNLGYSAGLGDPVTGILTSTPAETT
jgi:hypothetical protein